MYFRAVVCVVVVCAVFTGFAQAQPPSGIGSGPLHNYGYPIGPRVAPEWNYPGVPTGGSYVTYPPSPFGSDKVHRADSDLVRYSIRFWGFTNGLSICAPRVPVYGPVPTVLDSEDLKKLWKTTNAPGLAGYGWFGLFAASPRPRNVTVSSWAIPSPADTASPAAAGKGTSLIVSIRVPQPTAEVFVDGKQTMQTGIDRTFESPPLDAGKRYTYSITVRWVEGGKPIEVTKEAIGAPGEVVPLNFGR